MNNVIETDWQVTKKSFKCIHRELRHLANQQIYHCGFYCHLYAFFSPSGMTFSFPYCHEMNQGCVNHLNVPCCIICCYKSPTLPPQHILYTLALNKTTELSFDSFWLRFPVTRVQTLVQWPALLGNYGINLEEGVIYYDGISVFIGRILFVPRSKQYTRK